MKTFKEIPKELPITNLMDSLDLPEGIKNLTKVELNQLADEVREYLLYSVGRSGGHFGAGLGVIELTIALHHVFNSPEDATYKFFKDLIMLSEVGLILKLSVISLFSFKFC